MTPVEKARLDLAVAEAEERLALAKGSGDLDAIRAAKVEVQQVRYHARTTLEAAGLRSVTLNEGDANVNPAVVTASVGSIQGEA